MTLDAHANLPSSFVVAPPSPALSGTTLSVSPGDGVLMPAADPFNCTVWSAGVQADHTNSEIIRMTAVARTTIASGSNAAVLPQGTIHVASSASFPSAGTCGIVTTDGQIQIITYTGKGSGTLTGCTGGTGTMHTGDDVVSDNFTIVRTTESGENGIKLARSILKGDQIEATITKKTLTDIEGLVAGTVAVSDGSTTVTGLTEIDFVGAVVLDEGGGIAQVTVGGGAPPMSFTMSPSFGGGVLAATLQIPYAGGSSTVEPTNYSDLFTSLPVTVAIGGAVCDTNGGSILNIPVDVDTYNLEISVIISNMDGTEILEVDVSGITTAGDTELDIDWTTATPTATAGSDLSWDGVGEITSAAGGTFVVAILVSAFWT